MEADVANLLFISHELAMIVSMYPLSNEQNKCYQMLYGTLEHGGYNSMIFDEFCL